MAKKKEAVSIREDNNSVAVSGIIKKVALKRDKVMAYDIECEQPSPKDSTKKIRCWLTVKEFNPELEYEEGDIVDVAGHLVTESWEDKDKKMHYNLIVVAERITESK